MAYLDDSIRSTGELKSGTKHYLLTLATFANTEGTCYPSQATIATAMSVDVRTVRREQRTCLELGLISVKRRWRKSNVYKLLCIKKVRVIHNGDMDVLREQPPSLNKNVGNERRVPLNEFKALLHDLGEVVGGEKIRADYRWYRRIISRCSWEEIQAALAQVRQAICEGLVTGNVIHAPAGLLCKILRTQGAPI